MWKLPFWGWKWNCPENTSAIRTWNQARWVSCFQMNGRLVRILKLKSLLWLKALQRKEKPNLSEKVEGDKIKKNTTMTWSIKDQCLTLKKSVANLQKIHGVDAEFMLVVKNNIQSAGAKNSAPTAAPTAQANYWWFPKANWRNCSLARGQIWQRFCDQVQRLWHADTAAIKLCMNHHMTIESAPFL